MQEYFIIEMLKLKDRLALIEHGTTDLLNSLLIGI